MPAIETDDLVHDAVLWPRLPGTDDFGQPNVDVNNPVRLKVRWTFTESEATDPNGNTVPIDARVVVDREIAVGSRMWKGTLEDWVGGPPDDRVMRVVSYQEADDLRGVDTRRNLGLRWTHQGNP